MGRGAGQWIAAEGGLVATADIRPRHAEENRKGAQSAAPTARMRRPKPRLPIRREGRARDEYGATVAFLMSDDAGYITGTQLPVDGGYLPTCSSSAPKRGRNMRRSAGSNAVFQARRTILLAPAARETGGEHSFASGASAGVHAE